MRSSPSATRFVCLSCRLRGAALKSRHPPLRKLSSTAETPPVELSPTQLDDVQAINRLRRRLAAGVGLRHKDAYLQEVSGLAFEDAIKRLPARKNPEAENKILQKMEDKYKGREISEVLGELHALAALPHAEHAVVVTDERAKELLGEFGILRRSEKASKSRRTRKKRAVSLMVVRSVAKRNRAMLRKVESRPPVKLRRIVGKSNQAKRSSRDAAGHAPIKSDAVPDGVKSKLNGAIAKLDKGEIETLEADNISVRALDHGTPQVPVLRHDLSRVLFNPGVYHLQDPRSGVFNFDPYLQRIMPVSEFNYEALNDYTTSSEDELLRQLAQQKRKKYIGSSSSMNGTLTHFHYLLSQYRELNISTLSQKFRQSAKTFTAINKCPTAIFLRNKGGIYAVDADKEFDNANILMELGKSMEKLLTLPKDKFEEYRRNRHDEEAGLTPEKIAEPEAYHYCEQGDLLLRSQLDAYDPRLPGTGMFDLKTRAVLSIRMNVNRHQDGLGYQIRSRFGDYESFEREYYDMIRSAFLKYSLQARMGRMDGIFVAYHNIEQIFGFQYISLPELDLHLHGQEDGALGDQEFKLSLQMASGIFERVTRRFPDQSLRIHFETREGTTADSAPWMYIFAQPFEDEEIKALQDSRKEAIAEFKQRILNPTAEEDNNINNPATDVDTLNQMVLQRQEQATQKKSESGVKPEDRPLFAATLRIRNRVNDVELPRPENLTENDKWVVEYTVEEHSEARGRLLHTQCLNRRKNALTNAQEVHPNDFGYVNYLKRLKELSEKGAEWRKLQDEMAAQREPKVLYKDQV